MWKESLATKETHLFFKKTNLQIFINLMFMWSGQNGTTIIQSDASQHVELLFIPNACPWTFSVNTEQMIIFSKSFHYKEDKKRELDDILVFSGTCIK